MLLYRKSFFFSFPHSLEELIYIKKFFYRFDLEKLFGICPTVSMCYCTPEFMIKCQQKNTLLDELFI